MFIYEVRKFVMSQVLYTDYTTAADLTSMMIAWYLVVSGMNYLWIFARLFVFKFWYHKIECELVHGQQAKA